MDVELISLCLDAAVAGASFATHTAQKRGRRASESLTATIQNLDISVIADTLNDARIASFMRGAVTRELVEPTLRSRELQATLQELFLARLTDASTGARTAKVIESVRAILVQSLAGSVAEEDSAYFAEKLSSSAVSVFDNLLQQARAADPQVLAVVQQGGLLKRAVQILENIEAHSDRIERRDPASRDVRETWILKYRQLCQRRHGYITPPDFETNRKIRMQDLYVVPRLAVAQGSRRDSKTVPSSVSQLKRSIDRTVLLGDPGGGKSTLSNYLASEWAAEESSPIPFHITLREFATRTTAVISSVLEHIEQNMSTRYQHAAPAGLVEDLLISGSAVVIFDGLDELIDTTLRREVTNIVELFGEKYPLTGLFVTSRRVGYDQARLDPDVFKVTYVAPFSDEDVTTYVKKWFSCQEEYDVDEAEDRSSQFVEQSVSVQDLRSNPLMLALMCIIFRGENFIPRSRPLIYEKCATLLFDQWDGHRNIEVPLDAKAHVDSAMKFVAHWMLETGAGDLGVSYRQLVDVMAKYLHNRAAEDEEEAQREAKQFVDFCKGRAWVFSDAGTTADGEALFTFTHRTFMEYFAAYHLVRISDTPEKLARSLLPKVAAEEWDVVAQLAIQLADRFADRGSERALDLMLKEPRKRAPRGRSNVLIFISRCMSFSTVSPKFVRELVTTCVEFSYVLNRPNPHWLLLPLLVAIDSLPESLGAPAAGQLRTEIRAFLTSPDPIKTERGVALLGNVAERIFESSVLGINRSIWWLATVSDFVHDVPGSALKDRATRLRLIVPLLFAGQLSARETLDLVKVGQQTDFQAFYEPLPNQDHAYTSTLAAIVAYRTPQESAAEKRPKILNDLTELYLEAFWLTRAMPPESRSMPELSTFFFTEFYFIGSPSMKLVDARMLFSLVFTEMISRHFGGMRVVGDDPVLRRLVSARVGDPSALEGLELSMLSDEMREFVFAWAAGTAEIFRETGSPGGKRGGGSEQEVTVE